MLPRAKDFPDLGLFVTGVKTPVRDQTPDEMKKNKKSFSSSLSLGVYLFL